jgi:TonB family protein
MNPVRIAFGVLLAALIARPAWPQEQSAPPVKQTTPSATQADQRAPAASDSKPVQIKVGGEVEQAVLIHMVQPVYPKEAKDAGISGTVVVKGVITKDGSLKQVEYVSGPGELKQAAIEAVTQWEYKPTTLSGNPVDVETTISLVFALKKTDEGEPLSASPGTPGDPNAAAASQPGTFDALNAKGPQPPPPLHNFPARIRVGGAVQARSLVHQVLPRYPQDAKHEHISGIVVLHVIIARDGSVLTAEVVSGPDALARSAADAVKQWRYKPTLLNGQPVEVDTTVQVVFSIG